MDLTIKKPEQGFNTRLGTGVLLGLVGLAFCYTVYGWFIHLPFFDVELGGALITWGHVLAVAAGLLWTALCLWAVLFNVRSVEFLIKVDREIKKVTWPTWEQLKNSVYVIIGVIVFFGLIVSLYDLVFLLGIWKGLLGFK